jgi:plastocyanin
MPEAAHIHSTHRYFLWLVLLVLLIGFIYAGLALTNATAPRSTPITQSPSATFPASAPAPTPQDYVTAQKGFQYLVSYTDNGFAPKTLSVKKGETVRFTNNASSTLQLSLTGVSPQTLTRRQYFEYTFAITGTATYSDGTRIGTVTIK